MSGLIFEYGGGKIRRQVGSTSLPVATRQSLRLAEGEKITRINFTRPVGIVSQDGFLFQGPPRKVVDYDSFFHIEVSIYPKSVTVTWNQKDKLTLLASSIQALDRKQCSIARFPRRKERVKTLNALKEPSLLTYLHMMPDATRRGPCLGQKGRDIGRRVYLGMETFTLWASPSL